MVDVNLLSNPLRCPKCGSEKVTAYDDARLWLQQDPERLRTVADWDMTEQLGRQFRLNSGRYRCPKCGQLSLKFQMSGLWD
jgi:DNA-directed RNA polymerase subunit M/transcription elongation factor TFIIS